MKERIKKAVELRNQGKLEESNEVMKDLVKEYPENAEVNYQCAWSFDVLSLEKEAIPYYEKAIAGNYVRLVLKDVPCEFVEYFNPKYPVIVGGFL